MIFALATVGKNTRNAAADKKSVLPNSDLPANSKSDAAPNYVHWEDKNTSDKPRLLP
jgi:hypothetical protein